MKFVGFVGSPRKAGNTDLLVQQVLHGASSGGAETKVFYLNELNIKGCQGCNDCKTGDKCSLQDDMTPLYDELAEADGIVIGSPIYMSYVSGQTKIFLDRCYALLNPDFSTRLKKGKKAVLVLPQANPDGERYNQAIAGLSDILGVAGLEIEDVIIAAKVAEAGAVAQEEAVMRKAKDAGERLAKVIKMACLVKKPDVVSGPSKFKRKT